MFLNANIYFHRTVHSFDDTNETVTLVGENAQQNTKKKKMKKGMCYIFFALQQQQQQKVEFHMKMVTLCMVKKKPQLIRIRLMVMAVVLSCATVVHLYYIVLNASKWAKRQEYVWVWMAWGETVARYSKLARQNERPTNSFWKWESGRKGTNRMRCKMHHRS